MYHRAKPMHKTTSLLQALKVPKVSVQIDVNNLNLLNTIMKHNPVARDFYLYLLHNPTDCKDILTHRARSICNKYQFNMYNYYTSLFIYGSYANGRGELGSCASPY